VLFSPFLIYKCAEDGRNLVWLNKYDKFKARIASSTTGNVLLRKAQHQAVDCSETTLSIARYIIATKLQNARSVVKRASREAITEIDQNILNT
jgi:CRISP-associated protein Cas1